MKKEELLALLQSIMDRGDPAYTSHAGAFLDLLKKFASEQNLQSFAEACDIYLYLHPETAKLLEDRVAGILCNYYFNGVPGMNYERFIQWSLHTPGWADELKRCLRSPSNLIAAAEKIQQHATNRPNFISYTDISMKHIDILLNEIRAHLPFKSAEDAQAFLNHYDDTDRIAFISALYFGRSHIHATQVSEEFLPYLVKGEMNRYWEKDNIPDNEIARTLYEKGTNLTTYYDAFIRCTDASNYDRSKY